MKYITAKQFHDNAKCLYCSKIIGSNSRYCSLHSSYCSVSIGTTKLSVDKPKNNLFSYHYFYDLKYKNYVFEIGIIKNKNYISDFFEIYELKIISKRQTRLFVFSSSRIPKFMLLPGEQILKEIEKIKCLEVFK